MLTKKDVKVVAKIIDWNTVNPVNPAYDDHVFKTSLVENLADYFATQNPRFDRDRFMQACGLD